MDADVYLPNMFEYLHACAKVTDTRMIKDPREYDRALALVEHVRTQDNNPALVKGMTIALNDWVIER